MKSKLYLGKVERQLKDEGLPALTTAQRVAEVLHLHQHGYDPGEDYWCGWYSCNTAWTEPVRQAFLKRAESLLALPFIGNDEEKALAVVEELYPGNFL